MRLRIHRTDGKTAAYVQTDPGRISYLLKRLDPDTLFSSGPLVIGVHNPFSIINAEEICWVEVETQGETLKRLPKGVDRIQQIPGRLDYEAALSKQWPLWMRFRRGKKGDLLEALVELSLRSGESVFLHVTGFVDDVNLVDEFFRVPAICADFSPDGTLYINPKCITRARIYHSKDQVNYPDGFWMAEAEDI